MVIRECGILGWSLFKNEHLLDCLYFYLSAFLFLILWWSGQKILGQLAQPTTQKLQVPGLSFSQPTLNQIPPGMAMCFVLFSFLYI